jgi:hypothetical protein
MTTALQIIKLEKEKTTNPEMIAQGIVEFQMVKFIINFYGSEVVSEHDTKIMKDGRQFVINGCGFIEDGYEVL